VKEVIFRFEYISEAFPDIFEALLYIDGASVPLDHVKAFRGLLLGSRLADVQFVSYVPLVTLRKSLIHATQVSSFTGPEIRHVTGL
jgi:hypothetical protein